VSEILILIKDQSVFLLNLFFSDKVSESEIFILIIGQLMVLSSLIKNQNVLKCFKINLISIVENPGKLLGEVLFPSDNESDDLTGT